MDSRDRPMTARERQRRDGEGMLRHGHPTRDVLDRIGDRWTILVMRALEPGGLRYAGLQRRVPGISRKMLTQTLRAIERDGMVERSVSPDVPPRVEYALTRLGHDALGPIDTLCAWSTAHMDEVRGARTRYDRREPSPAWWEPR